MPRLFIALTLPEETVRILESLRPQKAPGLRPVPTGQVHLTLRFIGEAEIAPVDSVLRGIPIPTFPITFAESGAFPSRNRPSVLWLGLTNNPDLLRLHDRIDEALSQVGIPRETRPFHPHVTLARCQPGVDRAAVIRFLHPADPSRIPGCLSTGFALYSSRLGPTGALHQRERDYPVGPPAI